MWSVTTVGLNVYIISLGGGSCGRSSETDEVVQ